MATEQNIIQRESGGNPCRVGTGSVAADARGHHATSTASSSGRAAWISLDCFDVVTIALGLSKPTVERSNALAR